MRTHVSTVAPPLSVVLPMDRETGRPRGFAFVDYADLAAATEVIRQLNGQPFLGRTLSVSEARPREDRPRPPMGGGPSGFGGPRFGAPMGGPPALGGDPAQRRERNFGPPAPPKGRKGPAKRGPEMGPKGPIKVRGGGRVYDVDDAKEDAAKEDLLAPVEPYDDFATSLPEDKAHEADDKAQDAADKLLDADDE